MTTNTTQTIDDDPYQKLCRAMDPGLLITVNCSDPTAVGVGEMEVLRVDDAGDVHLQGQTGKHYVLTHNETENGAPVIKEVSETEFSPLHEDVLTIEVVGIAG